jgi:hypothetical protein
MNDYINNPTIYFKQLDIDTLMPEQGKPSSFSFFMEGDRELQTQIPMQVFNYLLILPSLGEEKE